MKIRSGFVSNSSSSSYVCQICGEEAIGMDVSLSDYEMHQCEKGHIFCDSHMSAKQKKALEEHNAELEETNEDKIYDEQWELPAEFCPICQMLNLIDEDELRYLRKKHGISNKETLKEIKEKFADYDEFGEFLSK